MKTFSYDCFAALDVRTATIRTWEWFFAGSAAGSAARAGHDAFLCLATSSTVFEHRSVDYWTPAERAQPFNLAGSPAITLPVGLDRRGLPIGIQLAGRRRQDATLLAVTRAVEAVSGAFPRPPGIS